MDKSQVTFETLVENFAKFPDAAAGKWFGKPCIKVEGKAFLVKFGNDIAFKFSADTLDKALQIEGAHLFDPRGKGHPFKEWVQIPCQHASQWTSYAEQAYDYVKGLK
jgi:hypothetical protein